MPRSKPAAELAEVDETAALRMLTECFGAVGLQHPDGWQWVTDGRGLPRNQRISELWVVQVTHEGKGWTWAHRTEKAAREMGEKMRGLGVRNVRVWRGAIEWTAV